MENSQSKEFEPSCPTDANSSALERAVNIFQKLPLKAPYFITGLFFFYTFYRLHQLYQPNRRERITMEPTYSFDQEVRTNPKESEGILRQTLADSTNIHEVYNAICAMNSFYHKPDTSQPPITRSKYLFLTEPNPEHRLWSKAQYIHTLAKSIAASNARAQAQARDAENTRLEDQVYSLKQQLDAAKLLKERAVEDSTAQPTQRSNETATQCSKEQTRHRENLHKILPNQKPTTLEHIKANITYILEIQKNMLNGSCTLAQSQLFTFGLREDVVTTCGKTWDKFISNLNSRTYADGEQLALNPAQVADTIFTKAVEWQEPVLQSLIDPLHDFGLKQTPLYFDLFTAAMVDVLVDLIPTATATEEHTIRRALRDDLKVIIEYLLLFTIAESNKRKSDVRPYISTGITKFTHHIISTDAAETQSAISTSSMRSDMTGKSGKRVKRVVVNEPDYTPLLANDLIKPALSLARLVEEKCMPDQVFREIMGLRTTEVWQNSPNVTPNRERTPSSTASSTSAGSPNSNSKQTALNTLWNSAQSYSDGDPNDQAVKEGLVSQSLFGTDSSQPRFGIEETELNEINDKLDTLKQERKASTSTNPDLENATLSLGEGLDRTGDTVQEDGSPDSTYSSQKNKI